MELRYQYGIAKNAMNHMYQNLENITDLGEILVPYQSVPSVILLNL
jgi:hypothetical protein